MDARLYSAYKKDVDYEIDIDALLATYQSLLPMAEEDEARLWKKFRLDWNYNSNRIEGNTLTYGETEALIISGTEPRRLAKDIREMKAHDLGIEYLVKLADDDRDLSEADIRQLNKIILKENFFIETKTADGNITRKEVVPGTYKTLPNHVRLRGGGIHSFAEPQDVPMRMENTICDIRAYLKNSDIPLADFLAKLHQDFIQTHPFDDGNGRVVRMVLNYICLKCGWPPIIIKDKKKSDYLVALERADIGDISLLVTMMRDELIWSLNKSIAAARGESIDDPEDLGKEIDLFVRENADKPHILQFNERSVQQILSNVYTVCVDDLSDKVFKFDPLFDAIEEIPYSSGLFTNSLDVPGEVSLLNHKWLFRRLNVSKRKDSFKLNLKIVFRMNAFEVSSYIELEEDGKMPSGSYRKTLHSLNGVSLLASTIFRKTRYDDDFTADDFSLFVNLTSKNVMKLIESMKS